MFPPSSLHNGLHQQQMLPNSLGKQMTIAFLPFGVGEDSFWAHKHQLKLPMWIWAGVSSVRISNIHLSFLFTNTVVFNSR